jgi:hypothetical protein
MISLNVSIHAAGIDVTSGTPCATPSCRRPASRIFGGLKEPQGETPLYVYFLKHTTKVTLSGFIAIYYQPNDIFGALKIERNYRVI